MARLNLAIASRIYLLEPQWNPSIESQAIGRALRLGRTTPVVVFRYIMAGTVEEVSIPNYYIGQTLICCRAMCWIGRKESFSLRVVDLVKRKLCPLKRTHFW